VACFHVIRARDRQGDWIGQRLVQALQLEVDQLALDQLEDRAVPQQHIDAAIDGDVEAAAQVQRLPWRGIVSGRVGIAVRRDLVLADQVGAGVQDVEVKAGHLPVCVCGQGGGQVAAIFDGLGDEVGGRRGAFQDRAIARQHHEPRIIRAVGRRALDAGDVDDLNGAARVGDTGQHGLGNAAIQLFAAGAQGVAVHLRAGAVQSVEVVVLHQQPVRRAGTDVLAKVLEHAHVGDANHLVDRVQALRDGDLQGSGLHVRRLLGEHLLHQGHGLAQKDPLRLGGAGAGGGHLRLRLGDELGKLGLVGALLQAPIDQEGGGHHEDDGGDAQPDLERSAATAPGEALGREPRAGSGIRHHVMQQPAHAPAQAVPGRLRGGGLVTSIPGRLGFPIRRIPAGGDFLDLLALPVFWLLSGFLCPGLVLGLRRDRSGLGLWGRPHQVQPRVAGSGSGGRPRGGTARWGRAGARPLGVEHLDDDGREVVPTCQFLQVAAKLVGVRGG